MAVTAHGQVPHFTKISNSGLALPDSAELGPGPDQWACTRDNRTGLTWEVKTSSGMRASQHNYSWRSGTSGVVGNTASCSNTLGGAACNTGNYANGVRAARLCGASDWRIPGGSYVSGPAGNSVNGELAVLYRNLFGTAGVEPGAWMPNTRLFWIWTSRVYPAQLSSSWLVNFGTGNVFYNYWDLKYPVLVVSDTVRSDDLFRSGFQRGWQEHFTDMSLLPARDWLLVNNSQPRGVSNWFQGSAGVFPAQSGGADDYIGANYRNTGATGTISNWLATPVMTFSPASRLSFWTRVPADSDFADRLEVRLCTGSACSGFGTTATSIGNYGTVIRSINPNLSTGNDPSGVAGYPQQWTRFVLTTADGLPASGVGRVAFRYFVTDAGENGSHSNYIGIDNVRYSY